MIFKPKKRYILARSSIPIDFVRNQQALGESLLSFMGVKGYANAMPKVIKQIDSTTFIIRTNRGGEKDVILALSFIKSLGNGSGTFGIYTLRTSGSIAALLRKSGIR